MHAKACPLKPMSANDSPKKVVNLAQTRSPKQLNDIPLWAKHSIIYGVAGQAIEFKVQPSLGPLPPPYVSNTHHTTSDCIYTASDCAALYTAVPGLYIARSP